MRPLQKTFFFSKVKLTVQRRGCTKNAIPNILCLNNLKTPITSQVTRYLTAKDYVFFLLENFLVISKKWVFLISRIWTTIIMIVLVLISTPLPNYSLRSSIATTSFCIVQAKEKADLRRGSLNNRTVSKKIRRAAQTSDRPSERGRKTFGHSRLQTHNT